jgi:hypothetical protein
VCVCFLLPKSSTYILHNHTSLDNLMVSTTVAPKEVAVPAGKGMHAVPSQQSVLDVNRLDEPGSPVSNLVEKLGAASLDDRQQAAKEVADIAKNSGVTGLKANGLLDNLRAAIDDASAEKREAALKAACCRCCWQCHMRALPAAPGQACPGALR